MQELSQLHAIFQRTKEAAATFMEMLQPVVDNAQDQHTRLYYHHILEEEEQRLGRLNELLPYLESLLADEKEEPLGNRELSRLLSDINLERFGLHNFREHLELSLYEFQDEERRQMLSRMREMTHADYLAVKEIMNALAERFSDVVRVDLTDHDEGHEVHAVDHVQTSAAAAPPPEQRPATPPARPAKKGLTVGSLRNVPL